VLLTKVRQHNVPRVLQSPTSCSPFSTTVIRLIYCIEADPRQYSTGFLGRFTQAEYRRLFTPAVSLADTATSTRLEKVQGYAERNEPSQRLSTNAIAATAAQADGGSGTLSGWWPRPPLSTRGGGHRGVQTQVRAPGSITWSSLIGNRDLQQAPRKWFATTGSGSLRVVMVSMCLSYFILFGNDLL